MNIKNMLICVLLAFTVSFSAMTMEEIEDRNRTEEFVWDIQSQEFRKGSAKTLWVNRCSDIKYLKLKTSYQNKEDKNITLEVEYSKLYKYLEVTKLPDVKDGSNFFINLIRTKKELYKKILNLMHIPVPHSHTLPDIYLVVLSEDSAIRPLEIKLPFRIRKTPPGKTPMTIEKSNKIGGFILSYFTPKSMKAENVTEESVLTLFGVFPPECIVKFAGKELAITERVDGRIVCKGIPSLNEVIRLPSFCVEMLEQPFQVPVEVIVKNGDGTESVLKSENREWFSYEKTLDINREEENRNSKEKDGCVVYVK